MTCAKYRGQTFFWYSRLTHHYGEQHFNYSLTTAFSLFPSARSVFPKRFRTFYYESRNCNHQYHCLSSRCDLELIYCSRHIYQCPPSNAVKSSDRLFGALRYLSWPCSSTRIYHLQTYGKPAFVSSMLCSNFVLQFFLYLLWGVFYDTDRCQLWEICGCATADKVQRCFLVRTSP